MTKPKPRGGLSRLDMTVASVAVILISAIIAVAYGARPENKGAIVAYLYPAYGGLQDVWMTYVDHPADAVQLTATRTGIYNFGVSPDGHYIAYAERDSVTGLNDVWLLNLQTRQTQQLTNCAAENADCRTPVFRPGGGVIAYERQNVTEGVGAGGLGAIRIWLLDLTTQPYTTRPLADDSQFIGHSPQWSASGDTIAFYSADITNPGIMVYNFLPADGEKSLKFVPANNGTVGTLAPNGRKLIFPDIAERDGRIYTHLKLADLDALEFLTLTGEDEPIEDSGAGWHPDGQRVAIERRYNDDRYTRGYQIYLFDLATRQVEPLAVDDRYSHGFFQWNASGEKLVFQRFALLNADGSPVADSKPEVWVKRLSDGALLRVAENAFHPRWVLP